MFVWILNCTVTGGYFHQLPAVPEKCGQYVEYRGWALQDTGFSPVVELNGIERLPAYQDWF